MIYLKTSKSPAGVLMKVSEKIGANLNEVLNSDLIIIATDHEEFKDVKFKEGSKILDCKSMFEEIPKVKYFRLGKASKS